MVSLKRVLDIIKEEREDLETGEYTPQGAVRGEVEFKNVSFQYDDDPAVVLQDVSFHCRPGQSVAMLGSTGSGKTTTLASWLRVALSFMVPGKLP